MERLFVQMFKMQKLISFILLLLIQVSIIYPSLLFTCSAFLNFYFAFYFQFALLLQISSYFFTFLIILFNLLG